MTDAQPDILAIFTEALARESGEARSAYLDEVCGKDPVTRERVETLLRAHSDAGNFLRGSSPQEVATVNCMLTERPGDTIGPYRLLEQIGEGGFGVVFMAEQTAPVKRKVALKVIKPGMDTREVIARFEAERQALALMDHPNIAKVLDASATDTGRPYFVMELVRGVPITDYCDQAQLTPRERLDLFVTVCHAVQHAHQKGIIHRDIKPTNVLVTQHDDRPVVKVIDFGIAKATSGQLTDKTLFTGFAQVVGTPLYMSPEQAALSAVDIDTRSDIYSLGVLLYELLTGTTPFDKARLQQAALEEVRRIIREEEPQKPSTRLSSLGATLPSVSAVRRMEPRKLSQLVRGDLDWIVMKALEKDRARRYETANGFAADVLHYLADEPVTACPPSATYRFRKFARRNKGALTIGFALAAALLLVVGSIGWAVRDREAQRQEMARQQAAREEEFARERATREEQVARERTEQQTRLTSHVELILEEVGRLEEEEKWPEALGAAQRAGAVAAGNEVAPDVAARVREVLRDLEMLQRLEEIRLERAVWREGKFDNAGAAAAYAQAFRDYGVDFERLPTREAVSRLKLNSRIALPLATAIDDFSWVRRLAFGTSDAFQGSLLSIARGLDPDPTRDRIRDLSREPNSPELRAELRALAESVDAPGQPPFTLILLGDAMRRVGIEQESQSLLRQAQQRYPDDFWINFELAYGLAESKDYEGAVRFYTASLAVRPSATAALTNLGTALSDQKKLDEAEACYRRAIELDPRHVNAHICLGTLLKERSRIAEAEECYRRAIESESTNVGALSSLGDLLRERKELDEAEECSRRAIELDPAHAGGYHTLGLVLAERNRLDEAEASLRRAVELAPTEAGAHNDLGIVLKNQRKLDEAEASYRRALELDPELVYAYLNLGSLLVEQKRLDEAEASYRRAIELDPAFVPVYCRLGDLLCDLRKPDEAEVCYRRAIELDPTGVCAHTNLGELLRGRGRLEEADACHRRVIEFDPNHSGAYNNLGLVLRDQGRLDEAEACYRRSRELDPRNANAHNNLGDLLRDRGEPVEAEACYRRALEIDPQSVYAHRRLSTLLHECSNLNEAEQHRRRAIELDPTSSNDWNVLGIILWDQKRLDESIACFQQAIELKPDSGAAWYNLAFARKSQGRLEDAVEALAKVTELEPDHAFRFNELASWLVTTPELQHKDPARAVQLAGRAVELSPDDYNYRHTLGIAHYRAGNWEESIAALEMSCRLETATNGQGNASQWLFLAMAHWQLGHEQEARTWYDSAVRLEQAWPDELRRYRNEAAALLGVTDPPLPEDVPDTEPTPDR